MSTNAQQFLTVEEVAERLRMTPSSLYSQRHRHVAPGDLGVRVGKRILWRERDIESWFDRQLEEARI